MKQRIYQQFIYKIESERILSSPNKNFMIDPKKARQGKMMISLADSCVMRMIDRLNGVDREKTTSEVRKIRAELRELNARTENPVAARKKRRALYDKLDEIQVKSDYLLVIMSKPSDFDKINAGFSVNGIKYKRLVGTPNGVKQSTVVYCPVVNENGVPIHAELERMLNGGRDETKKLVPAKFEAYKSLACSSSIPLSMPQDILVVDDFVLNVEDRFIQIEDGIESDDPIMTEMDGKIELNASDGFGLMCPALAERWSKELDLDYTASGICIRNLFCKGMVYTFDFHEFARRYAEGDTVTDMWGTVHTISDIELIVPVSVMKLWDSYGSLAEYLEKAKENQHTFAATKTCERELESERTLNYQFIQSYELTDEEIKALIKPTVDDIQETICGDANKTLLFLRGACGKNYDFDADTNYLAKAMMVETLLYKDPFVIDTVKSMIRTKINDLKIGKCRVHGNYSVISGDPFAFCQSIFGCDIPDSEKGLLKAREMYSKYWADDSGGEGKRVVCFRAPMSAHNNIRAMNVVRNNEIDFWYQYMPTVNIINCHDTFYAAENGADNDGDAILVTDNEILLRNTRDVPAIVCVQKKAEKCVITEQDLAGANRNGFKSDVGAITNRVTAMYDIATRFDKQSWERRMLEYRIMCGQQFQQSCIDAVKGVPYTPMPKAWYDWHSLKLSEKDDDEIAVDKERNQTIVADKKPYFMRYIYPKLKTEHNDFVKKAEAKCYFTFKMSLINLLAKSNPNESERSFIEEYRRRLPVTDENGTMNRLCHIVEQEFSRFKFRLQNEKTSNVEMLSSGEPIKINKNSKKDLETLYKKYRNEMQLLSGAIQDIDEKRDIKSLVAEEMKRSCFDICPDARTLCDVLLDICYTSGRSRKFVWDMCGQQIVENLLKRRGQYTYFVRDKNGSTDYCGNKLQSVTVKT